jgi:oxygen-dependent protoporphyrinogen oxidase
MTPGATAPARRVVVVGAGISGLACAWRLATLARERRAPLDLTVLEASGRAGGVIASERGDGFLVEAGPDGFITDKPWALDLCRRLGLERDILGTNPDCRRSFVLIGGRVLPVPEGYQLLAPSRLLPFVTTRVLSLAGKARAACDLFIPRAPERPDESLASFVRRRFGSEVLERLAQPLVAGIYDADPERLSLRATLPRFLEMERAHRSVILALLRDRRRTGGPGPGVSGARYSLFATLRDGLQTLVDRLAAALPSGALRLNVNVTRLAPDRDGTGRGGWQVATDSGERLAADAVVLALPAHAAAALLRGADAALAAALDAIPYGTSVTVNLAYRRADVQHPLDGFGLVVPRGERRRLVACTFSSVKYAGRAPEGTLLLRAFLGDVEAPERAARDDLRDILGITAAPLLARTAVWPRSMPRYEVGHLERVAAIEGRLAALPGLFLAGNGLRGVGIPDCVRGGEAAAEGIAARSGWYSVVAPVVPTG